MRRLRLLIEYDGTGFAGWQVQPGQPTVQESLETALAPVLNERVRLHGAGRTDAGVHALGQVAHFDTSSKLPPAAVLAEGNRRLPESIVIREAAEALPDFHARFGATGKLYRYLAYTGLTRPAYFRSRAGWFPRGGDREKMEEAGRLLLGSHDFSAFAAAGRKTANSVRTVRRLALFPLAEDLLAFEIEADGFLYRMARNIVGTLFEAGRGRFAIREIRDILESGNRDLAGPTAPPEGLCLVRVFY